MTMAPDTRGQTVHDFAIGMVIFLLLLGYVFAFIPSMFTPFAPDSDSSSIKADRTADLLTRDLLAIREPAGNGLKVRAGLLNATCTEEFFEREGECSYDDIHTHIGLPSHVSVRIEMQRQGEIATYPPGSGSGTKLARGPEPTVTTKQVIRAVRIVSLNGRDYHFVVKIW